MIDELYRWTYVLCVYTGLRAAYNRRRFERGKSAVSFLDGTTIRPADLGAMRVFVDGGPRPLSGKTSPRFGMISLRFEAPGPGRWLYRYLCLTSHFGRGQLEVAFYESGGPVTIFAVRDAARSNAARLGWRAVSRRLGSPGQDVRVVRALVARLERAGLSVRFAPAATCVALALDRRLVHPRALARTRAALERKYRRLPRALDPLRRAGAPP